MLDYTQEELEQLGAAITTREIYQQPSVWQETKELYQAHKEQIEAFLDQLASEEVHKVIFTGAGTSAYVGDTLAPTLNRLYDERTLRFESVATTDIVANPHAYLQRDIPTLLVSFARSGNSPESVACVQLAKQLVDTLYQLTITCAAEGQLALQAKDDANNLLLLQPDRSNDAGFAMTSSFSSMLLTGLLVFDPASDESKFEKVADVIQLSQAILDDASSIQAEVNRGFDRVIYLGAGPFFGLGHETQLKILELTAGQVATMYESPVGFRHGPKSFVNASTHVLIFGSTDPYTRLYDEDLVRELAGDGIASRITYFTDQSSGIEGVEDVVLTSDKELGDAYRAFPYLVFGQLFALLTSLRVGNLPDTPSPSGTVNRVVQGVIIHPLD